MGFVKKIVGSITGSSSQAKAAGKAADAQVQSTQLGIDETKRQFDFIQKLLQPFVTQGQTAVTGMGDLAGLNGASPYQAAIDAILTSPGYTSALYQGETSILQNASATGGLRGGNTQAALAQFSPALLSQFINDRYSQLGGLASLGQNAAAGVGNAGAQSSSQITQLLQDQGAARAGGILAKGSAGRNAFGDLLKIGSVASGFF